jgi:hypothetical protein
MKRVFFKISGRYKELSDLSLSVAEPGCASGLDEKVDFSGAGFLPSFPVSFHVILNYATFLQGVHISSFRLSLLSVISFYSLNTLNDLNYLSPDAGSCPV